MNTDLILKELAKHFNIETLPQETQETIVNRLGETILERTTLLIAETVTEEEAKHILVFQEQGDTEALLTYLYGKHPDLEKEAALIAREVINEFMGK